MDFEETLAEMNITLGDTEDTTFTPEEKTQALTRAWNDQYVVDYVWDDTGSLFSTGSYTTAVPTSLTTIRDIGIKASPSDFPSSIDKTFWEIIDGQIHWSDKARYTLTDGTALYVLGTKKLTVDDTISSKALQDYVVDLGAVKTLTLLGYKKANLFLKNDTSMGELIALKRELQKDIENYRARFPKQFQDMG